MKQTQSTTIEIQGPVVVIPLAEYLTQQTQLDEYRHLKTRYSQERIQRFARLLAIAERAPGRWPEQIADDVELAIHAARTQ